jgi:DNA polymerase III delta subunit
MRILLKAKAAEKSGSTNERAKMVGIHPFFLKTIDEQAKGWGISELKRAFGRLAQIDERIKSEAVCPENELRLEVLNLCSGH